MHAMCVYACMCMQRCVHRCMCTCVCMQCVGVVFAMCVHMRVHRCMCICVCMQCVAVYMPACVHMCACIGVCVHVMHSVCICLCVRAHVCVWMCVYTCTCAHLLCMVPLFLCFLNAAATTNFDGRAQKPPGTPRLSQAHIVMLNVFPCPIRCSTPGQTFQIVQTLHVRWGKDRHKE